MRRQYSYTVEFDPDGRLLETRHENPDGSEWITRKLYDNSGRLLKTSSGMKGAAFAETVYSYDEHGKLLRITNSGSPDNPIVFRYDEAGRKTKVEHLRASDYRANVGIVGSPFDFEQAPATLPGGGTTTTIYDDLDRPIAIQTRDAHGQLVRRALRSYDDQGRVIDEKQILASPEMLIPAEMRTKVLQDSGASLEQLRQELSRVMGGQDGPVSLHYSYDEKGQVKQTIRRVFNEEETIDAEYNEYGDKVKEITRTKQVGGTEDGVPSARLPYSEVRYSYEYDSHANWVHQTITYRHSVDGAFQTSTDTRREISYY